ncbi:type 1 fimbrial protein subunit FimI [Kosakonia quasisacchari]|uniref:type 1 fimbrial protein subunit FimI n=1 Tax=Kosakonia quasisacchari TaxID=2529380 RepID=UPI0039E18A1A
MMRTGLTQALMLCMMPLLVRAAIVDGGRVHLRGSLVNGACAVAPESEDLHVQMGSQRMDAFSGTGSFSPISTGFALRLTACDADVSRYVGVVFSGQTPAEDPQVFAAHSSGGEGAEGIGLALFDQQQRQIIPNSTPLSYSTLVADEITLHFSARYRAITEHITPGHLRSDVWFTLVYP